MNEIKPVTATVWEWRSLLKEAHDVGVLADHATDQGDYEGAFDHQIEQTELFRQAAEMAARGFLITGVVASKPFSIDGQWLKDDSGDGYPSLAALQASIVVKGSE